MLVLFYPHLINKGHSKVKQLVFCEYLGLKITTNPKDNWSVCCYMDFRDVNKPPKWLKKAINLNCNNVRKDYVDEIFTKIFGYSSLVNHTGYCVEKSVNQSDKKSKI